MSSVCIYDLYGTYESSRNQKDLRDLKDQVDIVNPVRRHEEFVDERNEKGLFENFFDVS